MPYGTPTEDEVRYQLNDLVLKMWKRFLNAPTPAERQKAGEVYCKLKDAQEKLLSD